MPNLPSSSTEFYEALGLAIVQWSRVEDAFCDLFTRLTICGLTGRGLGLGKDKEKATGEGHFLVGNIFYSTTNFRGRLELLDHMMERLVHDEPLQAEWNAIKNKAGKLYARRNILAHGAAWAGEHCDPEMMHYSVFSMQTQEMTFQQMQEATPSFYHYAERVTQLAIGVNAHLAGRKRYPEDFPDEVSAN
jgi:hypothetical protein